MGLYQKWKLLKNMASTENVLMTVSDVIKFYERNRININPAYQRNYRWTNVQKTKFIESILLKYPIPPIITIKTENDEGLYNFEIIDGVQRLATIFEFVKANNKNETIKNTTEKLDTLCGANALKEINNKNWDDFKNEEFDFIFESSTIMFVNLSTEDERVKYEIFERLNSLSSQLSPQEIRNSIIALKDRDKYVELSNKVFNLSKDFFPNNWLSRRLDVEFFVEFSLIKRYKQYMPTIYPLIEDQIRLKTKDKDNHFNLLLTVYVRESDIDEMMEDLIDYKEFIGLNKGLYFKRFDLEQNKPVNTIIKFYFEILGFLYFKNKELINIDFYKNNFNDTYGNIMKNSLKLNNPNAKARFEKAQKLVEEYDDGNIFTI